MASKYSKQYTRKEFEKLLRKNGAVYVRSKGGHNIWNKDGQNVVIQVHPNQMQCKRLIKELCLIP